MNNHFYNYAVLFRYIVMPHYCWVISLHTPLHYYASIVQLLRFTCYAQSKVNIVK